MKRVSLFSMVALVFCMCLPDAFSLGVAHSYIPGGVLSMNKSDTMSFDFILQNAGDSTKVMVFKIKTDFPMLIGDDDDYLSSFEDEYRLQPNTNKRIIVDFHSPEFAAKFPIVHSHYEKTSSSGQINIIQETSGKFDISVGGSNAYFENDLIPYEYDDYRLVFFSNSLYDIDDLIIIDDENVKVAMRERVDLYGFDENDIQCGHNKIFIDSDDLRDFENASARITFYDLPYSKNPVILKDNKTCGNDCDIVDYDEEDGKLVFDVEGFSEYTTKAASNDPILTTTPQIQEASPVSDASTENPVSDPGDTDDNQEITPTTTAKGIDDFFDGDDEAPSPTGTSLPITDIQKDGAKKLFSALTWGFITLLASVSMLLIYTRDNAIVIAQILEGVGK